MRGAAVTASAGPAGDMGRILSVAAAVAVCCHPLWRRPRRMTGAHEMALAVLSNGDMEMVERIGALKEGAAAD